MNNSKKIDPINILIGFLVMVIVVVVGYLGNLAFKNNIISLPSGNASSSATLNQSALYLASPITFVSGKITNKSSNSINIDAVGVVQNSGQKTINLKISVPDTTFISNNTNPIPYLFNQTTNPGNTQTKKLSLQDLKKGDTVSVSLDKDLRFTNNNDIKAASIMVSSGGNSLFGTVSEVSGTTIKVSGSVQVSIIATPNVTQQPPVTKTYTINTNSNTEIGSFSVEGPKKVSLTDIKNGDNIIVYSNDPITKDSFDAVLITLQSNTPPPIPTPFNGINPTKAVVPPTPSPTTPVPTNPVPTTPIQ